MEHQQYMLLYTTRLCKIEIGNFGFDLRIDNIES